MSLKHAILGFLSIMPLSGYDLKKSFDKSVQHFWPANQSQIYRTLAGLLEEGFVKQEVIEREDRLDKKLYHLTDKGREELLQWLSTPQPLEDFREPFLIQLYFGGQIIDDEIVHLLQNRRQDLEKGLADLHADYQKYQKRLDKIDNPRGFFLSLLTLEFGIINGISELEWLTSVIKRLKNRDYTIKDFQLEFNN